MRIVKDGGIPEEAALRAGLEARFARSIASGKVAAWLCLDGPRPVASAALRIDSCRPGLRAGRTQAGDREGYVFSVYTAAEFRRRGIAGALLGLLLEEARALGLVRLRLHPTADSRPLYLGHGFADFRGTIVRLSFHAYNGADDAEAAVRALA